MEIKTLFGTNLKHYRKEKHLSQEQLSEKANISVKHLSKIERGLTFVSSDLLEKLSGILDIPIAKLFCKPNEKLFDESVLVKFDRISEKHLIRALEGIKADTRENFVE
jgi:transcriptional regulator with XRE-family HTH domain